MPTWASNASESASFHRGSVSGKCFADVAERGGAEQRVGDCVGDGIGIAVTVQARRTLEHDPTEHQRSVGVVTEAVDVEALADTNVVHRRTAWC